MTHLDVTYTSGVIAAREKYLLKERITRLCELNAEDAFRVLLESGFGGGAAVTSNVYEYEKLIEAEEASLDSFIREYAPSEIEKAYLLSARDFHNAKAFMKAAYLKEDVQKMLSPMGIIEVETIASCVENKDYKAIYARNAYLGEAMEKAALLLEEEASGAKIGEIFEKALYAYLGWVCKKRKTLKCLLEQRVDMTNILTALRAGEETLAKPKYLPMGSLKEPQLSALFDTDLEKVQKAFTSTSYADFVKICLAAKEKGLPYTEAEKIRDGLDVAFFAEHKYELKKSEPFLYYVYRRRKENANVRIIFVCLLAGLSEQDVKKRLRVWG